MHRRVREKNDEGVYARLNLCNVETGGLVVRCPEIIQAIPEFFLLQILKLMYNNIIYTMILSLKANGKEIFNCIWARYKL